MLGTVTRCAFYAWVGSSLIEYDMAEIAQNDTLLNDLLQTGSAQFNVILIVLIVVMGVMFIAYQYILMPYLKRKRDQMIEADADLKKRVSEKTGEAGASADNQEDRR